MPFFELVVFFLDPTFTTILPSPIETSAYAGTLNSTSTFPSAFIPTVTFVFNVPPAIWTSSPVTV